MFPSHDRQAGKSYEFEIAGDAPSNSDFASIAQFLEQERGAFGQQYEEFYGRELEEPDRETSIREGLRRGYQNIKQAVGETVGTIGEQAGLGFLAQYGQDTEEKARQRLGELSLEQRQRLNFEDVEGVGTGLQYAGQIVGEQIPQLGLGIGAAVAAPVLAGATGLTATAVGLGGYALTQAPILFGNNIQRTEDVKGEGNLTGEDINKALVATFGQTALEAIAGKVLLFGGKPLVGAGKEGWKGLFARTTSRVGTGGTTEGLTEVGQQMMERAQAGLPIDSDDAIAEYREAAIAGGLIGGGTRATIGVVGEPSADIETPTPPPRS